MFDNIRNPPKNYASVILSEEIINKLPLKTKNGWIKLFENLNKKLFNTNNVDTLNYYRPPSVFGNHYAKLVETRIGPALSRIRSSPYFV